MVICLLIPRAYLNSDFLAKIRANCVPTTVIIGKIGFAFPLHRSCTCRIGCLRAVTASCQSGGGIMRSIAIIGAGQTALLAAHALHKQGYEVRLYADKS